MSRIIRGDYAVSNYRARQKEAAEYWTRSPEEVVAFGRDLVCAGLLHDADDVQEYYEKPHGWQDAHEWWEENDRPDSAMAWEEYDPYRD